MNAKQMEKEKRDIFERSSKTRRERQLHFRKTPETQTRDGTLRYRESERESKAIDLCGKRLIIDHWRAMERRIRGGANEHYKKGVQKQAL